MRSVCLDVDLKGHFVVVYEAPLGVRHVLQNTAVDRQQLHTLVCIQRWEHEGTHQPEETLCFCKWGGLKKKKSLVIDFGLFSYKEKEQKRFLGFSASSPQRRLFRNCFSSQHCSLLL